MQETLLSTIHICDVEKSFNKILKFHLLVTLVNRDKRQVTRTYAQFQELRKQLSLHFPDSSDILPTLPSKKWFQGKKDEQKKKEAVSEFCREVLSLPEVVLRSKTLHEFFTATLEEFEKSKQQSVTGQNVYDDLGSQGSGETSPNCASPVQTREGKDGANRESKTGIDEIKNALMNEVKTAVTQDINGTASEDTTRPNLPRIRGHAYDEIDVANGRPLVVFSENSKEKNISHQGTVYASVVSTPSSTGNTNQPMNVEYADVTSITVKLDKNRSSPSIPFMPEEYANASELHNASLINCRTSGAYAEVVSQSTVSPITSPPTTAPTSNSTSNVVYSVPLSNAPLNHTASPAELFYPNSPFSPGNTRNQPGFNSPTNKQQGNGAANRPDNLQIKGSQEKVHHGHTGNNARNAYENVSPNNVYQNTSLVSSDVKKIPQTKGSARRQRSNVNSPDLTGAGGVMPPIPPMPSYNPPAVPSISTEESVYVNKDWPADQSHNSNEVLILALADFTSDGTDNVLSFKKGNTATLLVQSDIKWWCVRLGDKCGWVPADYWKMLTSGDCVSLNNSGKAPWFSGKLGRNECESLLMKHGQQRHFFVRESTNLAGHYALSVKYNDKIHHFPIELTAEKKYNIGNHDFKTLAAIITYYTKNALFYDDDGSGVTLGTPLVVAEETQVVTPNSNKKTRI